MISILVLFTAITIGTAQPSAAVENTNTDIVCAPSQYEPLPEDCLPLGPAATYVRLAKNGIDPSQTPLPAYRPDASLNTIPYLYFKVDPAGVAVYPSLEAATAKAGPSRYLAPGFLYVSYLQRVETEQGVFYMLPSGEWIEGAGSRVSPPVFQGLQFARTPRHAFGWVLTEANTYQNPNYNFNNPRVRTLYRLTQVEIFAQKTEGDTNWYLIAPDEWIDARFVAAVFPNPTPPEGVTNNRWIEVNLQQQTLAVYENRQLQFATIISSGVENFWTQPGLFQIYQKKESETMSGAFEADRSDFYYLQNVPWTMYYDQARALHGAYWQTLLGYQRSHGCVNLSIGDARWLYDWAREGDWVWVHDPSGRTPTDPSLYGSGGF